MVKEEWEALKRRKDRTVKSSKIAYRIFAADTSIVDNRIKQTAVIVETASLLPCWPSLGPRSSLSRCVAASYLDPQTP